MTETIGEILACYCIFVFVGIMLFLAVAIGG